MRRRIKLTESTLRKIIKGSVKKALKENAWTNQRPVDRFHPDWWYYRQEIEPDYLDYDDPFDDDLDDEEIKGNKQHRTKLTESDLHRIVKQSVNRILQEAWADDYYAMRDKRDYQKDLEAYKASPWYKRLLKRVMRQNPQDPNPDKTAQQLAQQYVNSFKKEHATQGVGRRIDYNDGSSMHTGFGYNSETHEPIISATYYDGSTAFGDRQAFDDQGYTEQWGLQYPYSECGVTGRPNEYSNDVKKRYRDYDNMRDEVSNVIRNYKPRRGK